jgi:hypothetical protein
MGITIEMSGLGSDVICSNSDSDGIGLLKNRFTAEKVARL